MAKRSFADIINQYQILISGLKKNENELSLPIAIPDFEEHVSDAVEKDRQQEDLKAQLQQSTEQLTNLIKDLKEESSRLTSAIYSYYGKKSEKLEEFGIKPWKKSGRKGNRRAH
ncbi:MAG: hypothetical protein SVZ03_08700 [Spirochaetota bacterium]|nr:hypothetical protein [Spirochaetota bacterium]